MNEGDLEAAKKRIDQVFDLLLSCAKKGVMDLDRALVKKNNIGFLEDRAIYIDAGKLVRFEGFSKTDFKIDLSRLRPLHKWLMQNYPVLANYFDKAHKRTLDAFE